MIDVETELRTVLAKKAEAAEPPPETGIPPSTRRRVRRLQATIVAATTVALVTVAAGGVVTADRLFPGPPPVRPVERPTDGPLPIPPPDDETMIATGTLDGQRWELVLSYGVDGWCLGVHTEMGSGFGCPYTTRPPVQLSSFTGADMPKFVYGALSADVDRAKASTAGGHPIRLRLYEVPRRLDAPIDRAFIAIAPKGTTVIVTVYDQQGEVIQSAGT